LLGCFPADVVTFRKERAAQRSNPKQWGETMTKKRLAMLWAALALSLISFGGVLAQQTPAGPPHRSQAVPSESTPA
jgi:hypothetical protein